MAIDPNTVGATAEPVLFEWTDRDTMLYALGVGAGTDRRLARPRHRTRFRGTRRRDAYYLRHPGRLDAR
jgi:hypothetical protein